MPINHVRIDKWTNGANQLFCTVDYLYIYVIHVYPSGYSMRVSRYKCFNLQRDIKHTHILHSNMHWNWTYLSVKVSEWINRMRQTVRVIMWRHSTCISICHFRGCCACFRMLHTCNLRTQIHFWHNFGRSMWPRPRNVYACACNLSEGMMHLWWYRKFVGYQN